MKVAPWKRSASQQAGLAGQIGSGRRLEARSHHTGGTMTIDERLEGLARTVELIAHIQQAEEKRAAERDVITDQRLNRILDGIEKQAGNID
jgi:hypothetical protein